jgi:hypothetical protein
MDEQDKSIEFTAWLIKEILTGRNRDEDKERERNKFKDSKYEVEGDELVGIGQICHFLSLSERTVRRGIRDKIKPIPVLIENGELIASKKELQEYLDNIFYDF